jgi:enamine deaminase RidA (YjgF/YER057c/UK114 family)
MAQQGNKTPDPATTGEVVHQAAFEDGMALALWIHGDVHPQLKRWNKSGDRRVKLMAAVISDLVYDAEIRRDWPALQHMYDVWRKNEGDQKPPDDTVVEATIVGDDDAPF